MHRYRKRPANMLISAILASIMFIIIANSFMNLWGNSFTTLTAAKTATQAQAYSDIVSEKIKLEGTDAEEVTTKTKLSEITGNDSDDDWFYTYEIENETEDDNGNIFKVASIKIYKDDENGPRYSTEIPLSSLGNISSFNVPDFSHYIDILPYPANLPDYSSNKYYFTVPDNGFLCMYTQPWGNGRLSCDIRINNILIPRTWFYTVGGGDDWYGKTYTILLKKDDYVVISNLHRIQQITFYYCRK